MSGRFIYYTCPRCHAYFELVIDADYFIPGVEGIITDRNGEVKVIQDPTKTDHYCDDCTKIMWKEFGKITGINDIARLADKEKE